MRGSEPPTFDDLPLSERARLAAHSLGWRAPTPIQAAVVPHLAVGRDVIGRAETGSGKTGAYGLVLTDAVKAPGLHALVLAPTRELAQQITKDLNALATGAPFRALAVYGGVPYDEQVKALRDPATTCVVATTGRLLDLLAKKQVVLDDVRVVIIDEADRMLDLGFLPEVERVLKTIPGGRQTALFTATLPRKIAQLAHRYMSHPRELDVGEQSPESAEHYRLDVPSQLKLRTLVALLHKESPKRAIVFVRTRDLAREVAFSLDEAGIDAIALHGDLTQPEREVVLADLRAGRADLVVATDVAARGLDIPELTHVINFDVPEEAEQYVHRAGRTARMGRRGRVFTIVSENDGMHVAPAERAAEAKLKPYPLEVDGVMVTRSTPLPPRKEAPGGNARGARPRRSNPPPTPPKKRASDEADGDDPRRDPEHDLPPSRRARRPR